MAKLLTKSKFKLALECPTKLWYYDRPDEYTNKQDEDSFLKALAEGGAQVEALARCYYPDGIPITASSNKEAIATTLNLFQTDTVTLFEASFQYQGYFLRADILQKRPGHIKLIEVKAKSISKKDESKMATKKGAISSEWCPYIADIAFQKWVLKQLFPSFTISSYLMLVDKDALCPTDGLNQKFLVQKDKLGKAKVTLTAPVTEEDLSVKILKEINVDYHIELLWQEKNDDGQTVKDQFLQFSQLYFNDQKFPPKAKKECGSCQFKTAGSDNNLLSGFKECWRETLAFKESDFNDPTILDLWDCRDKPKYFSNGLIKLKDIDESDLKIKEPDEAGLSRTQRQWLQIEKVKNQDKSVWIDEDNLHAEMNSWEYPLHFIDFETAMLPIPFNKGAHPYQGIAFQYSHHTLDKNGNVAHVGEYLNSEPGVNPTIDFIRHLKRELENDEGTIFRYSNHENTYLNFILDQLEKMPDPLNDKEMLCSFIRSITKSPSESKEKWEGPRCMVDILELIKRFYYDPLTNGSNSIKQVFPAILNRSKYLQEKYSQPIYGAVNGIPSHNFVNQIWIVEENQKIKDPYHLLPPINKDISDEDAPLLFESKDLKEGGAATIAYAKLQFTDMSDFERLELRNSLLRYCELDTLAMVMIIEAWQYMLKT
ncbi:DUF2779 domain-containing protein [Legionella israelensis]|uniref:DUF2779 domain-containing protein n=1 Tax=Legionella israelensis TaxID=454 RepID=A0A0W0VGZ2_9GAMM|nr:DUF2779 domain-containing protein [Legionella israelensis]KTD19422.1 hypothetical protein Lisr_1984 [Legionella israelensis]QBS10351.1 DUF2779 domain-containing protein [Legionella israelensis]SCY42855.1 protein of unknown function [Legionella israelensis DSM 19235]STX59952.1 Domain of uncharacterised function(DUF2779) [Legionella israelensis]